MARNNFKHGYSDTPTYNSWKSMLGRVRNKSSYQDVHICKRWQTSFLNFLEDMGERPEGTSLDRINPYGNYCLENCRWATEKTQQRNKRNTTHFYVCGEWLSLADISEKYGISYYTLRNIYKKNRHCTVNSILRNHGVDNRGRCAFNN